MTSKLEKNKQSNFIRREPIVGSRNLSNYLWSSTLLLFSCAFFLIGILSYFHYPCFSSLPAKGTSLDFALQNPPASPSCETILPFSRFFVNITFFPQGLVMCFYGFLGFIISMYLWFTLIFGVGEGFNEFNKETGQVRIFRLGFPGKNRKIDLSYSIKDIISIKVEIREGFNPKRALYMRIKGKRDIPLTQISQPLTLEEVESQAVELARFLQVSLETN